MQSNKAKIHHLQYSYGNSTKNVNGEIVCKGPNDFDTNQHLVNSFLKVLM